MATCDYDVIVITETLLVSSIPDPFFTPSGWIPFRRDRYGSSDVSSLGGGVLIIARDHLSPAVVDIGDNGSETLWVRLRIENRFLYVGGAYVTDRSDLAVYSDVSNTCGTIQNRLTTGDDAILFSDINLRHLEWRVHDDLDNVFVPHNASTKAEIIVADELLGHGFFQLNNVPNSNSLQTFL